ncbi:glycine/sarcosine/betaine reductase complex component C subunit beta [Anoxynatronum buryatiense]|uniref:Betaine reductase n=1 Tax=Anoxynatronum buryatiense TaxID=489973 RepID=A0AA45WV90_9CLOT|nr:glycine/sarcosine/betaine reductase complex component C subunit beta [Anoxynatronum buryatiense]SMP51996.1 betaine reductase [Anoxynatronum buryatiense]
MSFPVIKGTGYVLVHTPDIMHHHGTTQSLERAAHPDSEYLKSLNDHTRSYEDVVAYAPNQTYIGNLHPEELRNVPTPWFQNGLENAQRVGTFGEIMPQDEFYGLMKISDAFDLVSLEEGFLKKAKEKLEAHPLFKEDVAKMGSGDTLADVERFIKDHHADPLFHEGHLVGCVKRAHDVDVSLTAHIIFENLVSKASGVLAMKHLVDKTGLDVNSIDYVIECSEEACGDMNQRGGGNFAKAIAEVVGAVNATGSDLRAFCAAPTHALIEAAALVKAGVYENVVVVAGGATAKLGMNGKDHVKKEMPLLEDVVGGFAVLVSQNDGVNPVIRTDLIGRHTVGTGSSPQAVITSLITAPLDKGGLKIIDIDKYSVEMQNPDITKPAGAGDVPEANYKMIGALGVKRGDLERADLAAFVTKHGMPGWAPTQGHIPSGIPYVGYAQQDLTTGDLNKTMIVGKGSLFLARMTNLFDGVSVVLERNSGEVEAPGTGVSKNEIKEMIVEAMKELAAQLMKE